MKNYLHTYVYLVFLFFSSCTKEILIDVPPQLEIQVTDLNDQTISAVSVSLYLTLDDWDQELNAVATQTTDSNGIALFETLDPQTYFFYAEKGVLNNKFGVATHSMMLAPNQKIKVTTQIK